MHVQILPNTSEHLLTATMCCITILEHIKCHTSFCYALFWYTGFHFYVIPHSLFLNHIISDSIFLSYLFLLCFIPLQLVPVPHYTWFQIEISVIPDSVMPVSLISLCTFWLYLIMLSKVLLYSTSYLSCVVPYFVMPLSVIPKSIYDRFLGPIWPSYLSNFAATQNCSQCPRQPQ